MSAKAGKELREYESVLYRIYTEDANRKAVIRTLQAAGLPPLRDNPESGFTLLPGVGYGAGQGGGMESSLVCDVVVPYSDETDQKMQTLAEDIRRENANQAVVLIVRVPCVAEVVRKKESKNHDQGAFQFAIEDAKAIRPIAKFETDGPQRPRKAKVGKIVARIGEWKKLLYRNKLRLRANSRDLVEFEIPVRQNLIKQATAGR